MALGTWWRGDILPDLSPLPSLSVQKSHDIALIAGLADLSPQDIEGRFQAGNKAYLAFIGEVPVAYGWVATQTAGIRELQFSFTLLASDCYLWDFLTLPEWRGRGIYPHLLQAIIRQELSHVERFWIGYAPGNVIAKNSISRAGFTFLADFVVQEGRVAGLELFESSERANAIASVFNLPVIAP